MKVALAMGHDEALGNTGRIAWLVVVRVHLVLLVSCGLDTDVSKRAS